MRKAALLVALSCALALLGGPAAAQDTGWTIKRFHSEIAIEPDGSLSVVESIAVDFGRLERHGIFREIPVRYFFDDDHDRVYRLRVTGVSDAQGDEIPYDESGRGANVVVKIGDPDRTITGRQSYRIAYEVEGALNGFADHDELFWNATGQWPVPIGVATARVQLEGSAATRAACFQGHRGSTDPCDVSAQGPATFFTSRGPLEAGEQLTVVVGLPKGYAPEPAPIVERARRDVDDLFEVSPLTLGIAAAVVALAFAGLFWRWLAAGRDRKFLKRYYLEPSSAQSAASPLDREVIVTEYEPPELLRPAEVGLLLDETADTKDLTATIVDLAVRGYLTIEEIRASALLGRTEWILRRTAKLPADRIAAYEQRILDGLFEDGPEVKLSDLKGTFHGTLGEAQKELYRDAVERRWFAADPYWTRMRWQIAGFLVALAGIGLTFLLAITAGWGIVGVAFIVAGVLFFVFSMAMPSRSAHGRELLLRILGFRRYMETAETERQRFAERENIFAAYLPYAIVFGSVTKWASAFSGIDTAKATAGWYTGSHAASLAAFSSDLSSMSSAVSSAISSTPASSGSSGFSGGSAGGGGGGGGGGSW